MTIEPLGGGRFAFELHTAIPGRCGYGLSGEAQWVDGRAVFKDQGGEQITFINQNHAITIEVAGPGQSSGGPCSLAGRYTNPDTPPPGTIDEIISDIRVHDAAINSQLNRLKTVEADIEGQASEGSQLKAW